MNICTKYGFDILIISDSYGGHRRHRTYDGRRTTPRVWHKLPTGEITNYVGIDLENLLAQDEAPPAGGFREVKNVKI